MTPQRGFWTGIRRLLHIGIRPTAEIEIRRLQDEQAAIQQAVQYYQRQADLARLGRRRDA